MNANSDQPSPLEYPLDVVKEVSNHAQVRVRRERQVRQIKAELRRLGVLSVAGSDWLTIDHDNNIVFGPIPDDRITLLILALADVGDALGRASGGTAAPGPSQAQLPGLQQRTVIDVSPVLVNDNDGRHLGGTR